MIKNKEQLKRINKRIVSLKKDYFKFKEILDKMWEELYYLHEEVNKLE